MSHPCPCCAKVSGLYDLTCLACCARLVLSARPSRLQQEVMLAAIERQRDAPKRAAILAVVEKAKK